MSPLIGLLLLCVISLSYSFAPPPAFLTTPTFTLSSTTTSLRLLGGDGDGPDPLTRDSEPDEFFSSKMDEMSDAEKLPIALLGLAGIRCVVKRE